MLGIVERKGDVPDLHFGQLVDSPACACARRRGEYRRGRLCCSNCGTPYDEAGKRAGR